MTVHIKRRVHRNSSGDLLFRNELKQMYPHGIVRPRPEIGLHTSLFSGPELGDAHLELNQETAYLMLQQPDSSREGLTATVKDVYTVARSRMQNQFSVALRLENDPYFEADRAYYRELLGGIALRPFSPHVTLAKVSGLDVREHRRLFSWIEERAPTTIALTGLSLRIGTPTTESTERLLSA